MKFLTGVAAAAAAAAAAVVLAAPAPTLRTLKGSASGQFAAKVVYPDFGSASPLAAFATKESASSARYRLDEWILAQAGSRSAGPSGMFSMFPTISVQDGRIISFYYSVGSLRNGLIVQPDVLGVTVAASAGKPKRLQLRDLLRPGLDPATVFGAKAAEMLKAQNQTGLASWKSSELMALLAKRWVLTQKGVLFLIPRSTAGGSGSDFIQVKMYYKDLAGSLDPKMPIPGS